jgi:RNA polymerase sigma factor for flagellar operon FliA
MCPQAHSEENPVQDRENLVMAMLPLVKHVALKIRKRLPAHVEVDDLVSDGVLGLVDAAAKFNPRKRVKFAIYARHRIRGSILDGLRSADPVPRDIRRKHKNLEKHYQAMEVKFGRAAKDEEMAARMGVNVAQWHRELNAIQSAGIDCHARPLSASPKTTPASSDTALLAGDGPNPFDLCCRGEEREILDIALSELRERERQIITLYYKRGLSMQEIAVCMNVDASRVSQLHATALVRLKAKVDCILHPPLARRAASGTRSMAAGAGG